MLDPLKTPTPKQSKNISLDPIKNISLEFKPVCVIDRILIARNVRQARELTRLRLLRHISYYSVDGRNHIAVNTIIGFIGNDYSRERLTFYNLEEMKRHYLEHYLGTGENHIID